MIIQFTKINSIVTLILGIVVTLILKHYYYGGLTMVFAALIGIQSALSEVMPNNKNLLYTSIPAYTVLSSIILTSFFILYKSKTVKTPQTIFTIAQLVISGIFIVFLRFMKDKFSVLNEPYINYVPTLFFLGFIISVSIIKDNQDILRHTYSQVMYDVKDATTEEY
jgi:hypothetical protein